MDKKKTAVALTLAGIALYIAARSVDNETAKVAKAVGDAMNLDKEGFTLFDLANVSNTFANMFTTPKQSDD